MKKYLYAAALFVLSIPFCVTSVDAGTNYLPDNVCRFPDSLPTAVNPFFQFGVLSMDRKGDTSVLASGLDFVAKVTGNMEGVAFSGVVSVGSASNFEQVDTFDRMITFTKQVDSANPVIANAKIGSISYAAHYLSVSPYNGSEATKFIVSNLSMTFRNPVSKRTYGIYTSQDSTPPFADTHFFIGRNLEITPAGQQLSTTLPYQFNIMVVGPKVFKFSGFKSQIGISAFGALKCPNIITVSLFRVSSQSQNPGAGEKVGKVVYKKGTGAILYLYKLDSIEQLENSNTLSPVSLPTESGPILAVHTPGDKNDWIYAYQVGYTFDENEKVFSDLQFIKDISVPFQLEKTQIYFSKSKLTRRDEYIPR